MSNGRLTPAEFLEIEQLGARIGNDRKKLEEAFLAIQAANSSGQDLAIRVTHVVPEKQRELLNRLREIAHS